MLNSDNGTPVAERVLANRGLTNKKEIEKFLKLSFKKGMHNPFTMKGMDVAIERIEEAIKRKERIMIFGDYDVDGISGTAILYHALRLLGGKVSYRLPHRVEHGYGLSIDFIKEFSDLKVGLLITVDCGISSREEIDLAKDRGIDVIITDHHTIPENIPNTAYAILHPGQPDCQYPFKGLTGAGVAYKLACALITAKCEAEQREEYIYGLLDLASLGTVADLGPLVDENRIIVKYGLEALRNTRWQGLNFLMQNAGIEPDTKVDINTIGYSISPRLNAAGRIDNPYYALQLLLYEDADDKARMLASHLESLNKRRQQMVIESLEQLNSHIAAEGGAEDIIIAWHEDWHVGILGLLAAKSVEKHHMPTIIMQDLGKELVGSSRGPAWFNLVGALTKIKPLLKNFGGHVQAAGFTLEKRNLKKFVEEMKKLANEAQTTAEYVPTLNIDCELTEKDIDDGLVNFLEQLEPYGISNLQPTFMLRNVRVEDLKTVGKDMNHLHFKIATETKKMSVIAFKFGPYEQFLREHDHIDLACHLERNEWKGFVKLQLRALDIRSPN